MNIHIRARTETPHCRRDFGISRKRDETHIRPVQSPRKSSVSIIGLGYVGCVSMACLSKLGHKVQGIDLDTRKIDAINNGGAPIVEAGLKEMLRLGLGNGLVSASKNLKTAIAQTDITFISVGTPTSKSGGCDISYIRAAARSIGEALRIKSDYHVVVLRCSVPPGTTMDVMVPEIEKASGKLLGDGFGICFNPEFLREGTAVADFFSPPKTVIGASDQRAADMLADIYRAVDAHPLHISIGAAEMVKYVDNVWHATKVTFANETGRFCKELGIDSHEVMNVFVRDKKLNLSAYYLKPGFAFGGSCLPKEVRAMEHMAIKMGIKTPLMKSLTPSNLAQIETVLDMIEETGCKRVGFLGVTFKPDTDDLRESPTLAVMARLHDANYTVMAHDVNLTNTAGMRSQLSYIAHTQPELSGITKCLPKLIIPNIATILGNCDLLIVSHKNEIYQQAVKCRRDLTKVIDLVRLYDEHPNERGYEGISW